ncbi:NADP-dependent oxidoreductase [Tepidamorphus sp. 3E244]|uniref:NADP-dependent oxidoreductase n=1 Tax=Tepidamorphus sp. 3E244 TaxID=3385498 RepID=UPI0038FD00C2
MPEITAIRYHAFGDADVLTADRVAVPTPGPDEVLVDVYAASVNPIDWKIRSGMMAGVMETTFPAGTGRDGAGVISAVGAKVDPGLVGTRVCFLAARGIGTWAEQIVLPAELAVPVPDGVSLVDAASLPLAGLTAWLLLDAAPAMTEGTRVLVHGASGGVGSMAVQIARERGAEVIATGSSRNADFVRSLGASLVVPYDTTAFEDEVSDVDIVFDAVGGDVHRRSYAVLKPRGTMVCLSAEPFEDLSARFDVTVAKPTVQPDPAALAALVSLVAEERIAPVVQKTFPFADFASAQRFSESGTGHGKTVLVLRD